MSLRWWWVRHAPTGAAGAIGWTDLPADLSDAPALARLARLLPTGAPVLSSDLARARATADALARGGARLAHEPALRELHFGAWEGRDFDAIGRDEPEAARAFFATPETGRATGGESFGDLIARVARVIAALNAAPPAGDLVVVAHSGTIRAALTLAGGLSPRAALGWRIDPLSVTRLDWLGDAWAVDRVNHRP